MLDRDGSVRRELAELEERLEQAGQETRAARRRRDEAVEERDGAKNVIQGYQLRVESRQKKAQEARTATGSSSGRRPPWPTGSSC